MSEIPDSIICDTLVRLGLVGSAQIEKARHALANKGDRRPIQAYLLERGIIDPEDLERARAVAAEAGTSPEALLGMNIGGFQIEKVLGQGGMGVVYRATELSLERPVALKVLPPSLAADTAYVQRFEREAKAAAKIHHPAVATIFAVGSDGPHQYIAMELLDGGTLKERILGYGTPGVAERRAFLAQILDGLSQAHKLGVIHRDLKPDNILLTADGRPKIADFGIARDISANGQVTLTGSGMMGSPLYMAPELWEGKPASAQTDLWALGISYWFTCEGSFPFHAKSPMEISRLVTQKDLPYKAFRDAVDRKVLSLLLARKPEKRAKSALEVLAALRPHTSAGSTNLLAVTSSQRVPVKKTPLASQLLQQTVSRTRDLLDSPRGPSRLLIASVAAVVAGTPLLFLGGQWLIGGAAAAGVGVLGLIGSLAMQRNQRTVGSAKLIPPGSTYSALIEATNALGHSTRLEAEPTIPVAPRGHTTRLDSSDKAEAAAAARGKRHRKRAELPKRAQKQRAQEQQARGTDNAQPANAKSAAPATTVKAKRRALKQRGGQSKQPAPAATATAATPKAAAQGQAGKVSNASKLPATKAEGAAMPIGEGRTIVVPRDVPTIHEALAQARAGDTVFVNAGNYTMEPAVVPADVRLAGQSAEGVTVIGDAAKGPMLTLKRAGSYQIANLALTMQNSGSEDDAKKNELIRVRAGDVSFEHIILRGAPGHGLRLHGETTASLKHVTISGAARHGMTVSGGAQAQLDTCTLEKCSEGGALVMDASSALRLEKCKLLGSTKYGVAARQGGSAELITCTMAKQGQYGVLAGDPGSVVMLKDCRAQDNQKHGALALSGGALKLDGGTLSGNGQAGVAVQNEGSSLEAAGVMARENKAYGAYIAAGASAELRGCQCLNNKEAGVVMSDADTRAKLHGVHASDNGTNGITLRKGAHATLEDCHAASNPSFGMVASEGSTLDLQGGDANDNGSYGLAYLSGSGGTAVGATFKRNHKAGVCAQGKGTEPSLKQLTCVENDEFGMILSGGTTAKVEECTCMNNGQSGIAIWDAESDPSVRNSIARANARFGVVIAGGAKGLLDGNTCNGNRAAGIFLQDAGTTPVLRNNSANANLKVGIFINKETDPVLEWNVANGNPESNIADDRES